MTGKWWGRVYDTTIAQSYEKWISQWDLFHGYIRIEKGFYCKKNEIKYNF